MQRITRIADMPDHCVGFKVEKQVGTIDVHDRFSVHRQADGTVQLQFATEFHYGAGVTQRSESAVVLNRATVRLLVDCMLPGEACEPPVTRNVIGPGTAYSEAPAGRQSVRRDRVFMRLLSMSQIASGGGVIDDQLIAYIDKLLGVAS